MKSRFSCFSRMSFSFEKNFGQKMKILKSQKPSLKNCKKREKRLGEVDKIKI